MAPSATNSTATNRPGIMEPDLYHPVLDCFVRGLPHHCRVVDAQVGTSLLLQISGACGGQWFLSKGLLGWQLVKQCSGEFASRVTIPQDLAWRVFTKGIDRESARAQIHIEGDQALGERILDFTAVIA